MPVSQTPVWRPTLWRAFNLCGGMRSTKWPGELPRLPALFGSPYLLEAVVTAAATTVVVVANWILLVVVLVILLGRIERAGGENFGMYLGELSTLQQGVAALFGGFALFSVS